MLISMNVWARRDLILKMVVESGTELTHFSNLRRAKELEWESIEDLQNDLYWLGQREMIDIFGCIPGEIGSVRALREGVDHVEHSIPVREASDPTVRRPTVRSQVNYNSGSAVNIQGDGNTVNQTNESEIFAEIVSVLREHDEGERADELQTIGEKEGKKGALKTLVSWLADNLIGPVAKEAVVPLATQALSSI